MCLLHCGEEVSDGGLGATMVVFEGAGDRTRRCFTEADPIHFEPLERRERLLATQSRERPALDVRREVAERWEFAGSIRGHDAQRRRELLLRFFSRHGDSPCPRCTETVPWDSARVKPVLPACHPERNEGSHINDVRFLASLEMTKGRNRIRIFVDS